MPLSKLNGWCKTYNDFSGCSKLCMVEEFYWRGTATNGATPSSFNSQSGMQTIINIQPFFKASASGFSPNQPTAPQPLGQRRWRQR